jgi:hypothetical protein
MPTKHPRHAITETGEVAEALAALRAELGPRGFTLAELVVLGAQQRLFEIGLERRRSENARRLLADRIRNRTLPAVDVEAFEELRRSGWGRTFDE